MTGHYAGDVSSKDAYAALEQNPDAVLVDCRTDMEWEMIGVPRLPDLPQEPAFIEWLQLPEGAVNPHFLTELQEAEITYDRPVYFICRSGVRSRDAAILATEFGYTAAYNVSDGFEGPPDEEGRRGATAGWQADGLPWGKP